MNIFLGSLLLLAPMAYHGVRSGLFIGFSWTKLWRTVDRSILFQGSLAILTYFPLWLAGIASMGERPMHPAIDVLTSALFFFHYVFWAYYVPVVVIIKLIRFVAKRIAKPKGSAI